MRTLGLIPARGGSKGIPRKNLRPLGGRPLLAWTAEAALGATTLQRVVLSTDDEEIAAAGRELGLETPFLRVGELARDDTPMLPVILDALDRVEAMERETAGEGTAEGTVERYDALCLLQPTTPFRTAEDIDRAVTRLAEGDADTVISVLPVPHEHNPHWTFVERDGELVLATGEAEPIFRRQDLPPAYHRDGSLYVVRTESLRRRKSLYGERIARVDGDPRRAVNLDEPADWERAEEMLAAGIVGAAHSAEGRRKGPSKDRAN